MIIRGVVNFGQKIGIVWARFFIFNAMSNTKRINVVLTAKEKRYFEEVKKQKGVKKDSQALRALLKDHEMINNIKY